MDSALKEMLKEERRRKSEKDKRSHKSDKPERSDRSERVDRSERSEKNEKVEQIDTTPEKFIFVYEDKNGEIFSTLDKIDKSDGDVIKIFPVYITNGNENLTEEEITVRNGKYVPSEENKDSSWLSIIGTSDTSIFDLSDIVVYNGRFFHCEKDLIEYIHTNGAEYLSINK